jgi:hypothetical protein
LRAWRVIFVDSHCVKSRITSVNKNTKIQLHSDVTSFISIVTKS